MNTAVKKVLVVFPYYPPHEGGVERYAHEIVYRIHGSGAFHVEVLTSGEADDVLVEHVDGVTVHRLPYRSKISNSPFSLYWFGMVRRLLREVRPDVVHIHTPVPGLGDLVALLLSRTVPLVVTYHAGSMRKGRLVQDILVWLYEHSAMYLLLWRANHIVCSSDFVRTVFLRRYMHKSETITPAVDQRLFTPHNTPSNAAPTLLAVGGLSRAEKYKGMQTLIELLPQWRAKVPGTHLVVVGEGDERAVYERRIREKGLEDGVTFLGRQDRSGVARAFASADVFVLPTRNDSFPTVILEAMASGIPVVSTSVGSIEDMVEDGSTGFVVPPDDTAAFAMRVEQLLGDSALCRTLGTAGRVRVEHGYSWEDRATTYVTRYKRLCNPLPTVAHVASYFPPHVGGIEVVVDEVAHELARREYSVEVFTSTCGAGESPRVERETHYRVRRLRSTYIAHTPILWSLPFRLLLLPRNTIIHLHLAQAFTPEVVWLVAVLRRFPIVAQFHLDVEPSGKLGWLFVWYKKNILSRLLRQVDAVMVFSEEQEDVVATTHGVPRDKIFHVTNAVADLFFRPRKETAPHIPFRVLTLSRLTVQKRVDRLIEAMALLTFPAELVIVGDGEDRAKLEALAQTQCPDKVRFDGTKSHAEAGTYHDWADVFVVPSEKEGGMPLTALEAMAAGVPVVGSNLVGIRELVRGVGLLVDNPSPETFAAALTTLHNNPDLCEKLSKQSVVCAQQHTWPKSVDLMERVYRRLL